ncbi:hypothetical protein [Deinococcus sp. UYEF24]
MITSAGLFCRTRSVPCITDPATTGTYPAPSNLAAVDCALSWSPSMTTTTGPVREARCGLKRRIYSHGNTLDTANDGASYSVLVYDQSFRDVQS